MVKKKKAVKMKAALTEGKTRNAPKTSTKKPITPPPAPTPKTSGITAADVTWDITNVEVVPEHKGMKDFVTKANYTCSYQNVDISGECHFTLPEKKLPEFKTFGRLNKELVTSWVQEQVSAERVVRKLNMKLVEINKPAVVVKTLAK